MTTNSNNVQSQNLQQNHNNSNNALFEDFLKSTAEITEIATTQLYTLKNLIDNLENPISDADKDILKQIEVNIKSSSDINNEIIRKTNFINPPYLPQQMSSIDSNRNNPPFQSFPESIIDMQLPRFPSPNSTPQLLPNYLFFQNAQKQNEPTLQEIFESFNELLQLLEPYLDPEQSQLIKLLCNFYQLFNEKQQEQGRVLLEEALKKNHINPDPNHLHSQVIGLIKTPKNSSPILRETIQLLQNEQMTFEDITQMIENLRQLSKKNPSNLIKINSTNHPLSIIKLILTVHYSNIPDHVQKTFKNLNEFIQKINPLLINGNYHPFELCNQMFPKCFCVGSKEILKNAYKEISSDHLKRPTCWKYLSSIIDSLSKNFNLPPKLREIFQSLNQSLSLTIGDALPLLNQTFIDAQSFVEAQNQNSRQKIITEFPTDEEYEIIDFLSGLENNSISQSQQKEFPVATETKPSQSKKRKINEQPRSSLPPNKILHKNSSVINEIEYTLFDDDYIILDDEVQKGIIFTASKRPL